MLTGAELLAKLKELSDASKSDLVRACGYVSTKKDGSERLDFAAFYEALLEAKGVELAESDHDSDDYLAEVLVDGRLQIKIPKEVKIKDSQVFVLQEGSFDPYLPGVPFSLIVEERSNLSEAHPLLAHNEGRVAITYKDLEESCENSFFKEQGYLAVGARFAIQPESCEEFALEPLVWTGIDADDEECVRLLVIVNQNISPLLGLVSDPLNEQLFDLDEFDNLEECISRCLRRAVELVLDRNPVALAYLESRGVRCDKSTILKRLNQWLVQIDESGGSLELLKKDISVLIGLLEGDGI
jgi:hypothetical protein